MPSPNQFFINIDSSPVTGTKYLTIQNDEWQEASRILSPSGFQLYLYLASIQHGYKGWELSKEHATKLLGFSSKTYARAVADLQENHYLTNLGKNHYSFTTRPSIGQKCPSGEPTGETKMSQDNDGTKMSNNVGQKCLTDETKMSHEWDKNDYRNNTIIVQENNTKVNNTTSSAADTASPQPITPEELDKKMVAEKNKKIEHPFGTSPDDPFYFNGVLYKMTYPEQIFNA